jgi:putative spermidine/putrescine transport system ATP-binding protein
MRAELKKLQRELGISFIHVTHGQDEALALADEIVVMNRAAIEQAGPPREVYDAPRTEFVARFMGGHNVLALPQGRFAIRSDRVRPAPEGQGRLESRVTAVEYQGAQVAVTARAAGEQEITALLPDDVFYRSPVQPGQTLWLDWEDTALHTLSA